MNKLIIRSAVLVFLLTSFSPAAEAQSRKKRKSQLVTVIETAESYISTPYVYGGNGRNGIDCSGLIHNAYKAAGLTVPRTAKEQSRTGKSKNWNTLREGDIVFFKFKQKGEKWWHSGIVSRIEGNSIYFIHASSSRGVVESNLMADYYRQSIRRIRRFIR
jgi:cell wall-associated NlpC family hydrolase